MPIFGPTGAALGTQTPVPATRAGAAGSSASASCADHAHLAQALFAPEDLGLLAWAYDPWMAGTSQGPVAATLFLIKVLLPQAQSVTNVLVRVSAAGSGLANSFAGVYSSAGTLVGGTVDQSTAWTTTGLKTMALSSGPFSCGPGFCWVGLLQGSGSTLAQFAGTAATDSGLLNGALAASAYRAAKTGSGLSALPASFTPSGLAANTNAFWVGLS